MGKDDRPAGLGLERAAPGLGGVWARENTREAIWDALKRKEVYATTGDRLAVRLFAGWDFTQADLDRPDFVANGIRMVCRSGGPRVRRRTEGAVLPRLRTARSRRSEPGSRPDHQGLAGQGRQEKERIFESRSPAVG